MIPTLSGAAEDIRTSRQSPLEILERCLQQIDRHEPQVRAWVLIDREGAQLQAEILTRELRHGHYRGPLHGIPLGIKDIFDVFDWPTAAGSHLWKDSIARHDATVVRRLREAGAIFLGKVVTTQYASFDPPPTRNPWDVSRTPGGSSSGSAAAVACGMCLGALGSQTGGSITRPAAYCGVAGCKPTYGRVSCAGVVPLAPSMDHPGPMARSVRDLALMLQVMAGPDPLDPSCAPLAVPDYMRALARVRPPRLARVRGMFADKAEAVVQANLDEAVARWHNLGAEIVEVALPASFAEVLPRHRTVMAVEAARYHEPRLRKHPTDYGPRIRSLLEQGLATPAPEYARCKEHQQRLRQEMMICLDGVEGLIVPGATCPAPDAGTTGDPAFNSPWSYIGYPSVCFVSGWTPDGLPLSLQVIGRPWEEATALSVASWCEEQLGLERREPARAHKLG